MSIALLTDTATEYPGKYEGTYRDHKTWVPDVTVRAYDGVPAYVMSTYPFGSEETHDL